MEFLFVKFRVLWTVLSLVLLEHGRKTAVDSLDVLCSLNGGLGMRLLSCIFRLSRKTMITARY